MIRFDISTVSEANRREHWAAKNRRRKSQQEAFAVLWRRSKVRVELPAVVTFTRYGARALDSDNLAGAFKAIRDQFAKEIGVDDGDLRIEFRYRQEYARTRDNWFTMEIGDELRRVDRNTDSNGRGFNSCRAVPGQGGTD